ncbi:hypothetical protein L5F25_09835 [Aliarcobacter butzleri]|uniref:HNH endonuclease n=1 Tax=Aliarcobacter butzleri TaxID=28197 RepID=UPI001EDC8119|nr:HNH endonuclease [Aliarcobacter butzleri]MCG3709301.1 hypothetical protein [Aliarcobacter butzleri]
MKILNLAYSDVHNTYPSDVLIYIKEFILSTNDRLNFIEQTSIFLNDESEYIKEYLFDYLLHYAFKRVFNNAIIIYDKMKENEKSLYNFKDKLKEEFDNDYMINNYENFDDFSEKIYDMVKARELSDLKSLSKKLRKFASDNKLTECYICGINTEDKGIKYPTLKEWYIEKEKVSNIKQEQIEKDEKFKKNICENLQKLELRGGIISAEDAETIFNAMSENIPLKYLEQQSTYSDRILNNNSMEIEHNFPKSWGGAKNKENLFVSCHNCNKEKKDITFYTEYSLSRFFSNQNNIDEAYSKLKSKLGHQSILSIKMKQNYKCANSDCENSFSSGKDFYLCKIDELKGYHFLNLNIKCKDCLEIENYSRISNFDNFSELLKEKYIKL